MSSEEPCPSPEALEDLIAGRLSPVMAGTVRAHLGTCERCKQRATPQAPTAEEAPRAIGPRYPFLHPAERPDEIGRLSNYRVLGLLGEGGMAHVFDAEDTTLNRLVALKVLRPEQPSSQMRERFIREAKLLATVDHPNIVRIYACGEDGLPFLAMERLPGESLEKRLERDVSIPVDEALWITRQVAARLAAAHNLQLIHRDVKPSNIWLEPGTRSRQRRVVLLDFGIARRANEEMNLTTIGQVLGTPSYMAPEQAMGLPVDRRADIYSLGCVLYQMVTGHSPFEKEGKETVAVLQAVIKGEPPPVDWKVPSLPVPVAILIKEMMSRDVRERPPTAEALIERIDQINDQPTIVPTASTAKPSRQVDSLGILLFVLVALVVLVLLAVVLWRWLS